MTPAYTLGWWAAATWTPTLFNPFAPDTVSADDWADGHADFRASMRPVERRVRCL